MNEMLGRLIRLIVKVPSEWLGVVCDLAEKLASIRGGEWYAELKKFVLRQPCWVAVTKTMEKVTEAVLVCERCNIPMLRQKDGVYECPRCGIVWVDCPGCAFHVVTRYRGRELRCSACGTMFQANPSMAWNLPIYFAGHHKPALPEENNPEDMKIVCRKCNRPKGACLCGISGCC